MNKSQPSPPAGQLVMRIVRLTRLTRIVMAALFALALTLALTPAIDEFYLEHFFDPTTTVIPALISTALGLAFYVLGWRLIIGYAGETPAPRSSVFWYCAVGAVACAVVVVLLILGAVSGTLE